MTARFFSDSFDVRKMKYSDSCYLTYKIVIEIGSLVDEVLKEVIEKKENLEIISTRTGVSKKFRFLAEQPSKKKDYSDRMYVFTDVVDYYNNEKRQDRTYFVQFIMKD